MMTYHHVGTLDGTKAHLHFGDYPCQSHAPNRCPKQLRRGGRRAFDQTAISGNHPKPRDLLAKTSISMMILTVNIGRQATAQSDMLGSRGHPRKPAKWKILRNDFSQRHTCTGVQSARSRIKLNLLVHFLHGQYSAATKQSRIAIASAQSPCNQVRCKRTRHFVRGAWD